MTDLFVIVSVTYLATEVKKKTDWAGHGKKSRHLSHLKIVTQQEVPTPWNSQAPMAAMLDFV